MIQVGRSLAPGLKVSLCFVLQEKLWWGWPGSCQGSQCQVPPGCHILLWGKADVAFLPLRGWWQKRWQELTLLSTSPCHIWLCVSSGEGKEFYLSWHHRGGLRRCPLKSQYSFCALQQSKCFKAVPCCIVCTPIPVEGRRSVPRQLILHFAKKSKGPSMKDKTCRMGVWESKKIL